MRRSAMAMAALGALALAACSFGPDKDAAPSAAVTLEGTVVEITIPADDPLPEPTAWASGGGACPIDGEHLQAALGVEITEVGSQIFRASDELLCTYYGTPYVVLELYVLPHDGRPIMHTCWADEDSLPLGVPQSPNRELELVARACGEGIDMRFTVNGNDVVMQASMEPTEARAAALADAAELAASTLRR